MVPTFTPLCALFDTGRTKLEQQGRCQLSGGTFTDDLLSAFQVRPFTWGAGYEAFTELP